MIKQMILAGCVVGLLSACGQNANESSGTGETAPAPKESNGSVLFSNNCVQCHAVKEDKIGPKLEGVLNRWDNDTSKIIAFVKNSQQVINSSPSSYPSKLYDKFNGAVMPPFPNLSDNDIKDIISYVNNGVQ